MAGTNPALAADQAPVAESQTQLGGVTVTSTVIDEGSYKAETASSPKNTAPLIDTPRSITVISSQLIQDTASTSLADVLRTVPGITLGAGEGGNPLGDRPFLRGIDSQNSTYLDGVRDIGAQSREVFAVESIEVTKGSDSTMGGRAGAGGTINLVSKVAQADGFVRASGSVGTATYKRGTVDANLPLNDIIGVRVAGMWHDQDVAGRDEIWSKRWGIAPSITLGLTGPTKLTASYYHLETEELPDTGIPYSYTIGNAPTGVNETGPAQNFTTIGGREISVPRGAWYGLKNRDFRDTTVDNFTLRASHDFGAVTLRNTSRWGRSSQNYIWTQPDDSQGNVYGTNASNAATAGGNVWRRINTRYGYAEGLLNQTDLFGDFKTGGVEHSFAISVEFSEERSSTGSYVGNALTGASIATGSTASPRCSTAQIDRFNCTSIDAPNGSDAWQNFTSDTSLVASGIERSLPKTRTLTYTDTKAVSVFDTIRFSDALILNLGGRFDRYETRVSSGLSATSTAARTWLERKDDIWSYQAGLIYKPVENASIYISTSSAATPPGSFLGQGTESNSIGAGRGETLVSLDDLKVEKTKTYEIGTKWDLFDRNLSVTLAAFQTETKNARTTVENGVVAFVGERRIRGIEFGFSGNITPEWSVFGGYSYLDAVVVDGGITTTASGGVNYYAPSVNTGKQFPNTPKHSFTAFTNYKVTPDFTVGGGAIYMGKVYGGYSDTRSVQNGAVVVTKELARYVPSYWRFDANAAYQITDSIGLQVNVQNLANKRYYDKAYSSHYANQAAGRTAIATINVKY